MLLIYVIRHKFQTTQCVESVYEITSSHTNHSSKKRIASLFDLVEAALRRHMDPLSLRFLVNRDRVACRPGKRNANGIARRDRC